MQRENKICIGINGLGRIGKLLLLQILNDKTTNFKVCAINATKLAAEDYSDYINFDSVHYIQKYHEVKVISKQHIQIGDHYIRLFQSRDAPNWQSAGVEYLFDCTGSFLTEDQCKQHRVPFTIISSPAKDKMPTFVYYVNEKLYNGASIVSGSSCTTNCLAPMLALLDKHFGVKESVFTTIHAATNSQFVTDVIQKGARTDRTVFNNIIPHTTGASSSVTAVLPHLKGKVFGTSVRVPVSNCSLVDLNVTLGRDDVSLQMIEDAIRHDECYLQIFSVTKGKRVSSDYMTNDTPCNVDLGASIDMGNGKFKLFLWYDNEWSYCAQLLRLAREMFSVNSQRKIESKEKNFERRFVDNMDLQGKGVVCRFDFNVPVSESGEVTDEFRISSTVETINLIRNKGAKYVVLASHFGRPTRREMKYSTAFMVPILEKYYGEKVTFLPDGISPLSLAVIQKEAKGIYLLENVRFHNEETWYEKEPCCGNCCQVLSDYFNLGDVFISDAFGCTHRKHLSVHGMYIFERATEYGFQDVNKLFGYGCLIQKEVQALSALTSLEKGKRILAVIGGNKIKDKLPIIDALKEMRDCTVYVAGGLARQYESCSTDANVKVMKDGVGSYSLGSDGEPEYVQDIYNSLIPFVLDAGNNSLREVLKLAEESDVIFWNGSLGKIEDERYRKGSDTFVNYLLSDACANKQIIIGGGETASLFDKTALVNKNNIYVSTGGGALLEFLQKNILERKTLVGLEIFYE